MKNKKTSINPVKFIIFLLFIVDFICMLGFYYLIPYFLSYPPNSINTPFQLTVNPTYYYVYFIAISVTVAIVEIAITNHYLKPIKKIYSQKYTTQELLDARKICYSFPKKVLLMFTVIPSILIILGLLLMKTNFMLTIKISMLAIVFLGIPNIIFYFISNLILKKILLATFNEEVFEKEKVKSTHIWGTLTLQIFPTLAISIIIILLFFSANYTEQMGNYHYKTYQEQLNDISNYIKQNNLSLEQIGPYLEYRLREERWFLLLDKDYQSISNTSISQFTKNYIEYYGQDENARIYDDFGTSQQGAIKNITVENTLVTIGILYDTVSNTLFANLLLISLFFIIIGFIIVFACTYHVSNNVGQVAKELEKIAKNRKLQKDFLPTTSSDELESLIRAFNKIQENTIALTEEVHAGQARLMEKERLASLGQLIGGIAHNLKTPIMSIAGAAEGLNDLTKEYDTSIEDPEVNFDDHHAIAKDMYEWIDKIKTHTSYMSDVITAVKGQAVALSGDQVSTFTMEELVKHVNILMRHELKNALVDLNVSMQTDHDLELKGNINSLVQVINNMISNAIQAYNGKTGQAIDLVVKKDNNKLVISIKDYGPGMNKDVKDKLFKEMITTKGKNGTGLGLFMSYSNIRAHFNGNITVDSELGKGTTFNIILPLN